MDSGVKHGDSGKPTWANERICLCGASYRTMPPYGTLPSFEQHVIAVVEP